MLIQLDDFRRAKAATAADTAWGAAGLKNGTYGADTVQAVQGTASLHALPEPPLPGPDLPSDAAAIDEAFMNTVSALASQI